MIYDPALLKIATRGIQRLQLVCGALFLVAAILAFIFSYYAGDSKYENTRIQAIFVLILVVTAQILIGFSLKRLFFRSKSFSVNEESVRACMKIYWHATLTIFVFYLLGLIFAAVLFFQGISLAEDFLSGLPTYLLMQAFWPRRQEFLSKISPDKHE